MAKGKNNNKRAAATAKEESTSTAAAAAAASSTSLSPPEAEPDSEKAKGPLKKRRTATRAVAARALTELAQKDDHPAIAPTATAAVITTTKMKKKIKDASSKTKRRSPATAKTPPQQKQQRPPTFQDLIQPPPIVPTEELNRNGGSGGKKGEKLKVTWVQRFQQLTAYKERHGHCRVPARDPPLGLWVLHQRQEYRKGFLRQERIELLESIGFQWKLMNHPIPETQVKARQEHFNKMVNKVKAFIETEGHGRVPTVNKDDAKFGQWVSTVRKQKKRGLLPKEREEKLTNLGFTWVFRNDSRAATAAPTALSNNNTNNAAAAAADDDDDIKLAMPPMLPLDTEVTAL